MMGSIKFMLKGFIVKIEVVKFNFYDLNINILEKY